MSHRRRRCPKCAGLLYREHAAGTRFALPPEWACLQCGWRQTYAPQEFERRFTLSPTTADDQ
jgi:RNase P subunit RPR2